MLDSEHNGSSSRVSQLRKALFEAIKKYRTELAGSRVLGLTHTLSSTRVRKGKSGSRSEMCVSESVAGRLHRKTNICVRRCVDRLYVFPSANGTDFMITHKVHPEISMRSRQSCIREFYFKEKFEEASRAIRASRSLMTSSWKKSRSTGTVPAAAAADAIPLNNIHSSEKKNRRII